MATKTIPSLETIERMLDEVEEWSGRVSKIRRKMAKVKRGTDAYEDLLADLWVELEWLKSKAETAARAIDEHQESLPNDD